MASTWSRFTSHKSVSTSLGTCTAQYMYCHFYLINNSNMRKCRTAVAIICNTLYNTTCIVHVCGYVYKNTICYSTELNKKEPNCTVLLQRLWHWAANSICFKVVREPWKVFQPCPYKFSFWWRLRCTASRITASSLEGGSFSCLIWPLFRWFSCFWWQKCSDIHNKSNHAWWSKICISRWWTNVFW